MAQASASIESFLATFRPLPGHKLEAIYAKGEFSKAWDITTAPAELAVTGAFILKEFVPDQRTVLARNPNYIKYLYVDKLSDKISVIVTDQNTILDLKGILDGRK